MSSTQLRIPRTARHDMPIREAPHNTYYATYQVLHYRNAPAVFFITSSDYHSRIFNSPTSAHQNNSESPKICSRCIHPHSPPPRGERPPPRYQAGALRPTAPMPAHVARVQCNAPEWTAPERPHRLSPSEQRTRTDLLTCPPLNSPTAQPLQSHGHQHATAAHQTRTILHSTSTILQRGANCVDYVRRIPKALDSPAIE